MDDEQSLEPAKPAELATLAAAINDEHRACESALRTGLAHAIRAGELLIQARSLCQHGAWLPWLRDNFEGSERLARAYMRVARELPKLRGENGNGVADLSFRQALAALAAPAVDGTDGEPASGEYGQAVQRASELLETIAEAADSWWAVAERTHDATTGEGAVSLEQWCADVSAEAGQLFAVGDGAIRRAAWIAYGAMPVEDRPWPEEAALSMWRLGVTA